MAMKIRIRNQLLGAWMPHKVSVRGLFDELCLQKAIPVIEHTMNWRTELVLIAQNPYELC